MRAQVYVSKQGMCDHNKVVKQPTLAHYLETESLFPAVRIFLDLFPRAGYFFNAFD